MILTSDRCRWVGRIQPPTCKPSAVIASFGRARHVPPANKISPVAAVPSKSRPGGAVTTVTHVVAITIPARPQAAIPAEDGAHCVCCTTLLGVSSIAYAVIHKRYQQWG